MLCFVYFDVANSNTKAVISIAGYNQALTIESVMWDNPTYRPDSYLQPCGLRHRLHCPGGVGGCTCSQSFSRQDRIISPSYDVRASCSLRRALTLLHKWATVLPAYHKAHLESVSGSTDGDDKYHILS